MGFQNHLMRLPVLAWEKGDIQVFPDLPDKFWVRFLSPHALYKEDAGKAEIVTTKNSGQRIFTKWAAKRSGRRGLAATRRGEPSMLARKTSRASVEEIPTAP